MAQPRKTKYEGGKLKADNFDNQASPKNYRIYGHVWRSL